jgi:CP family cyanate transporter-like MFS transporter
MLWLAGMAIRIPLLAIPPILPLLRHELGMSGTEIGAISGIPMLLMAAAAVPGSLLVSRLGASRVLLIGLATAALGGAARGFAEAPASFLAATAAAGAGIAVTQPALSALVRQWLPSRIGLGTAAYSNGLVLGCIFPVMMTLPLTMPFVGNRWQLDLVAWSIPVVVVLLFIAVASRGEPKPLPKTSTSNGLLPNLNFGVVLRIGLIFGANNCTYFGTNAFLPPYLVASGHPELVTAALTAYNFVQLAGTLLVLLFAKRLERRRWPYLGAGVSLLLCLAWLASSTGEQTVVAATALGLCSGITLSTGLMLPPLLSKQSEVAKVAAAMFTISYSVAMVGSLAGGVLWDFMGNPRFAFIVLGICILPLIALTPTLDFSQRPAE